MEEVEVLRCRFTRQIQTEKYNGKQVGQINNFLNGSGSKVGTSAGTVQTAAFANQWWIPGATSAMNYDGTSWTSGGTLNTGKIPAGYRNMENKQQV